VAFCHCLTILVVAILAIGMSLFDHFGHHHFGRCHGFSYSAARPLWKRWHFALLSAISAGDHIGRCHGLSFSAVRPLWKRRHFTMPSPISADDHFDRCHGLGFSSASFAEALALFPAFLPI
jgi:hypothetical protein